MNKRHTFHDVLRDVTQEHIQTTIKHDLAAWIDTSVIAEYILDELEEQGVQPTLDNAKTIWLDVLANELCEAIRSSIV